MNADRVRSVFAGLSGLSEEEVREQGYLCEMSIEDIGRLLPECSEGCGGREEYAAAALAYYRYVLWRMSEGTADVKVGDISVRSGRERLEYAERILKDALARLGSAADEEFVFSIIT